MLVLVKKPHIELSVHGKRCRELLAWIRKKYDVAVLSGDNAEEFIPVEETEFWKRMEKNRVGNFLAAARLKAGLTQAELAGRLSVRQNMISDYERGRRRLSPVMARRFSKALKISEERLLPGARNGVGRTTDRPQRPRRRLVR